MSSARPLHPDALGPSPLGTLENGSRGPIEAIGIKVRRFASAVAQGFAIDLRSLAAFRIAVGLLLLSDMALALSDVKAFYSDVGVLPREFLLGSDHWAKFWWSFHMMSGSPWFEGFLFAVEAVVAMMLLIGWRTRLATFVSWVLVCSTQARNPAILHGGDDIIRVMLFWSIFLPLGARWSVDARIAGHRSPLPERMVTLPGACLLLQLAIVYVFSAVLKSDPAWQPGGAGLRIALQMDHFVRPMGMWLREHDALCRALTTLTILLELWGAWLAFLPFRNSLCRIVTVAAFWALHAGIWLCMDVGPFPVIMAAAWLPFLPGGVWEKLGGLCIGMASRFPRIRTASLRVAVRLLRAVRRHLEPIWRHHATPNYGLRPSWKAQAITLFCFLYSLSWNIRDTDYRRHEAWFPSSITGLGHALRWEQYWGMFAPKPLLDDGWYVCVATLADGERVDLLRRGVPVNWTKPAVVSQMFWDSRWQKYLSNLWLKPFENCRVPMLRYLTNEWNNTHGTLEQVTDVRLWYVIEMTNPNGTVDKSTRPVETAHYVP
jgi:hypothetical protein